MLVVGKYAKSASRCKPSAVVALLLVSTWEFGRGKKSIPSQVSMSPPELLLPVHWLEMEVMQVCEISGERFAGVSLVKALQPASRGH